MSEMGFIAFNQGFALVVELLYAGCLTLFLGPFLSGRRRRILVFSAYLLLRLLWDGAAIPQGMFGLMLVPLPTVAAGILGLERGMAFLLALLYWNARTSSGLMVQSLFHFLRQTLPVPDGTPEAAYLRSAALLTVFLVAHTAILALMLIILSRQLRRERAALHWRELCYLSLAPTAGILFGQVISRLLSEFQDSAFLPFYERHPAFLAVVPILALLFYGGTCLTISFQQGMAALREEQSAHAAEYQQTQALQARIHEAERFYTHIRGLKHEMRGHMSNIRGLASRGEYTGLSEYIAKMNERLHNFEWTFQTGNPVTDVIVGGVERRSRDLGIRFQAEFRYPDPEAYDAFDVGIILQNLLENALEACGKVRAGERFIVLTGERKGRFFLIEVKNSLAGEVIFGRDGLPVTTKGEETSMHGIGLANVRREAEKYMGELEVKSDQREFSATVLLQERSQTT